jgi:methylenetetrahydrofolate dehydrogenase (NADP+)/methenyltetrahydrofolate cyclohydrolase/formyltetrahydrofolate synthetase
MKSQQCKKHLLKFLCPCAGDISLMPGTSSVPAIRRVDVDVKTGKVKGLF